MDRQESLQVFTLGRFSIVRDGQPLRHARKAPGKPLQLLKTLIAWGGREVCPINLAASLWPDQDGDRARQSFETTLHRLRRYLGDDRFLLQDGHLTLNSARVWVDVWEFQRTVSGVRQILRLPGNAAEQSLETLQSGGERIIRLYQGHFLARDNTACWSVSLQERLRSKFIHCMIELCRFWERHDRPELAIHGYQKDVDDLVESFYQRLMVCYAATGRLPEAMASYRQCRHILSVVLGLEPTAETRQMYHSLLIRYPQAF